MKWTVIGLYGDTPETFAGCYEAPSPLAAMKACEADQACGDLTIVAVVAGDQQVHAPEDYGAAWGDK